MTCSPAFQNRGRLPILDALRIFLAVWVTMSHFGVFPLFAGANIGTTFGRTLVHGWSSVVWGVPAVICFFLISGFCIHLPYIQVDRLSVSRYYARRYIRILIPVVVIIIFSRLAGDRHAIIGKNSILWKSALWSLFCEEIYYAVYPLALSFRKHFGWRLLLVPTFLLAGVLAVICPNALDETALDTFEVAMILFPIWLLGCLLAEQSNSLPPVDSPRVIWKWRFIAWLGSWIGEMMHFKEHFPIARVLLCFGVLAYFWIKKEIAYSRRHRPWVWLASAGLWSYSLYLVHGPAMLILAKIPIPNLGFSLNWVDSFAFILALSYLFYLVVERPSHRLARKFVTIKRESANAAEAATTAVGPAK